MQEKKAEIVLKRTMNLVKEEFPPLISAVNLLTPKVLDESMRNASNLAWEQVRLSTDGEFLFFSPENVLKTLQISGIRGLKYQLMHVLLHCILGHLELDGLYKNRKLLWLTFDREVGHLLTELNLDDDSETIAGRNRYLDSFLGDCYDMGCYFKAKKDGKLRRKLLQNQSVLVVDRHEFWALREKDGQEEKQGEEGGKKNEAGAESENGAGSGEEDGEKGAGGKGVLGKSRLKNAEEWERIRSRFFGSGGVFDRDSFLKELQANRCCEYGSGSGSEVVQVKAARENDQSYYQMLMQLFQNKESTKVPPDAIDYTLYQYGLELYEDVPLIEPPDCEEQLQLNTVCIAIDTSGSCSDRVAEHFLRETRNILRDISRISQGGELYLFQCDDVLQSEEYYASLEELIEKEEETQLRGFGGTSFEPVFHRLEELQEQENKTIDCLIYLTDAYGDYPRKAPDYPVFFILPMTAEQIKEDFFLQNRVPGWIQKVGMDQENG